ncbi:MULTISPECIES: glycosyltransferase [unclassified Synechococcus]|uniref:glycosyltransferase n=1 Tax=unclassified Synechococcus TaxID=2626047 RepID=UPI0039AEC4C7
MYFTEALELSFLAFALPTIILIFVRRENIKRGLMVITILAFLINYISWRLRTFPFEKSFENIEGIWIALVLTIELLAIIELTQYLSCIVFQKDRTEQAKKYKQEAILMHKKNPYSLPSVSILIPTFNEDVDILSKTIVSATNICYVKKKIYILDDGNRQEIKSLAKELDVNYITRIGNEGAKAGNINNALKNITSDLILIFDADFCAFKNCLLDTVGFFIADPLLSTLQTPQTYINADAYQHNLKISKFWGNEQEVFFAKVMPGRDFLGASYCCGSCCLIRTSMLKEIGGFPEWSITEDILLTTEFLKRKWKTKYLNQPIARGMAAETNNAFFVQRKRWGRGNIEVGNYLIKEKRLDLKSKILFYPFYWVFQYPTKIFIQLVPIVFFVFDIGPLPTSLPGEIFMYQGAFVIALCTSSFYMHKPHYLPLFSEAANLHTAIALAPEMLSALLKKKANKVKFSVTPKNKVDLSSNSGPNMLYQRTLIPISVLLVFNIFSFFKILLGASVQTERVEISLIVYALIWSFLNIIILLICFNFAIGKDQPRLQHRFLINKKCQLIMNSSSLYNANLVNMSLSGALIELAKPEELLNYSSPIILKINETNIPVKSAYERGLGIILIFDTINDKVQKHLIKYLYSGEFNPTDSSNSNKFLLTLRTISRQVFNL